MWYFYSSHHGHDSGILINEIEKYCIENSLINDIIPKYMFQVSQYQAEQVIYTEQSSKVKFIIGAMTAKIIDFVKSRIEFLSNGKQYKCKGISHELMTAIRNDEYNDFINYYNDQDVLELCLIFCGVDINNILLKKGIEPSPIQKLFTLFNQRDFKILPFTI